MTQISICITTFNRSDLTIESFSKVYDHSLVDEIVIVDDCSEEKHWSRLLELIDAHPASQKINVFRNEKNLGMSLNKATAISKAKNEWVILLDSDNQIFSEYIDSLNGNNLNPETIYCPVFARPSFDFREFEGSIVNRKNAKEFLGYRMFRVWLNCCNYVVNREKYLAVYKCDPEIKEADTIHFNKLWLEAGYSFYFVPGMEYLHEVHEGSGWLQNHKKNIEDANRLQKLIAEL